MSLAEHDVIACDPKLYIHTREVDMSSLDSAALLWHADAFVPSVGIRGMRRKAARTDTRPSDLGAALSLGANAATTYGSTHYRGAEQKTVADAVMVPMKEAKQVLYSMMIGGYVKLFSLPRSADHAPSRSFFLFEVDMPGLSRRVGADMYHAAFNLQ